MSAGKSDDARQWRTAGHLSHRTRSPASITMDRFIPVRSAMDFDFAHYQLTASGKEREMDISTYRTILGRILLGDRTRILSFNNIRTPLPFSDFEFESYRRAKRRRRYITHKPENVLDAPGLADDYSLNLLDWGSNNLVLLGLSNTVYLWDALDQSTFELVTVDEDAGPVTSVRWAPDGQHVAVGLNNSHSQLWDASSGRLLRILSGAHESRVGTLDWNNHILTTGGADSKITNHDVRMESHVVQNYQGHEQEVCGVKWSGSGQQLASGGNDNLIHIWDLSMTSNRASDRNQWVYRFTDHKAGVRALAWCPLQSNLLASGGGDADGCIKFWSTSAGACLNSVNLGSQVCALLWSKREMELLSSCGATQSQLVIRKYPSLTPTAELFGHTEPEWMYCSNSFWRDG